MLFFIIFFCGFLLSLSAPGFDLWFFAWIGIAPLFIIINTSRKLKDILFYAFLFGFSYNLFYLQWLFSLHPLNWLGFSNLSSIFLSILSFLVVTFYNSLFFVLFALSVNLLKKISFHPYDKGILHYLLVTFLWLIIFNKLSSCKFLLGFPWTLVEYSQYKNLFLIQIAEYLGSAGISFLIVFFNLVLANFLICLFSVEKIGDRRISKDPAEFGNVIICVFLIVALILGSITCGYFMFNKNRQHFSNSSHTVCVTQGNLPLKVTRGEKLDISYARKVYGELIGKNNAELLISPEGSLPTIFNTDANTQYWFKMLANNKKANLIFGSYCDLDSVSITEGSDKKKSAISNCAVSLSSVRNSFYYYEKERLVPFGEFTPFSSLLPGPIKKLAHNVIGEGFKEGKQNSLNKTLIGNVGIDICFELIFPETIKKQVLQGANFLVNLSDLSWFSNNLVKQQFLSFAVFRAIENRKFFIIAANNGISAFIEPTGNIKSQSLPNIQGVLLDWINTNNKITFYAKYGW